MRADSRLNVETISSRKNAIVGIYRALARARGADERRVLLEGIHLVEEARAAGLPIRVAAIARERFESGDNGFTRLAAALATSGTRVIRVSEPVMAALSPVRTSSGLVAIAERTPMPLERAFEHPPQLVIVLTDVQDPGNVGAAIRAAAAGGATGVVASGSTADPFGWKALRGAMGSTFRIPVIRHEQTVAAIGEARAHGLRVLAATPRGGRQLYDADLTGPLAILLGGEGSGLPPESARLAEEEISVPMRSRVESLNVAVTAALVVYEASRQRQVTTP